MANNMLGGFYYGEMTISNNAFSVANKLIECSQKFVQQLEQWFLVRWHAQKALFNQLVDFKQRKKQRD